jgi:hypothetical protein
MLVTSDRFDLGDPDTLVYAALIVIGVPLTMWELWHLGRSSLVYSLAALWIPTIVFLAIDLVRARLSKATTACFFAWVAALVGYGIYALLA